VSSPNNTTVPRLLNGRIKSSGSASLEADTTTPADPCSKALLENMPLTTQPRSNMKQNQSITAKNGGSESTVRKTGKKAGRGMEENERPCDVDTNSKPTTSQQEAQARKTQVEKLARLQKQEITKLGHKIRHQSAESTTSPQALSLARQASINLRTTEVPKETPQAPPVALSPTMAAQSNGMKQGTTSMNGSGVQTRALGPSREHNNGSMRSTNMNMRGRRGGGFQNPARSRWATTAEIKPPPASEKSVDSNAFGSELPSDAETASGDSVAPMDNGRLLRRNRPAGQDAPLADWSGNWMPPPIDWDQRPRFNNNSAQFVGEFGHWNETTAAQSVNVDTGTPFTRLSRDLVRDPDLHPDGLNLVDRTMTVDVDTANQYGYSEDAKDTIRRDASLIAPDIFTDDWGKLDMKDPDNLRYHNECCNDLVRNYNANIARELQEEMSLQRAQKLARRQSGPYVPSPNPHTPRINIYLRPAVRSDVPQMQGIYNQHVENSVHTSEIQPITYLDMLDRWIASTNEQLPFVVAVSKSAKINREIGNAVEKIVGWASATDWVTRYSVERFTVELDIYVHRDHRHQGVGKCLMDKLIDSTDRGHIARKGYPFTCAPEERHAYSAGGARNLMKLRLMVRSFDKPRSNDENDLPWIKKWLEDEWNFEQQGYYPKGGAKFKRQ
jgi:L-amino acid N-acyltransferase YncA